MTKTAGVIELHTIKYARVLVVNSKLLPKK
jgi:hypothetical protein